jgi:cytochrome b561
MPTLKSRSPEQQVNGPCQAVCINQNLLSARDQHSLSFQSLQLMETTMSMAIPHNQSYSGTAKLFHWVTVIFVALIIPMGVIMSEAEAGPLKNALFDLHRSFGVTVAILTIFRLIYRLRHPAPPLAESVTPLQRMAAHAVHGFLYAGLILLPLGGLMGAWMFGASLNYFWLFQIAPPMEKDAETAKMILGFHGNASLVFGGLIGVHVLAALAHHFVFKDNTLRRMMPH